MRSSVAMCTYNGARFLPEQLCSLLQQERLPTRVVEWDDTSRDGSAALLEAFAVEAAALGVRVELPLNPQSLVRNGNYWRYSHGLRSVIVDLLGRP